jgi:hypothetical protein
MSLEHIREFITRGHAAPEAVNQAIAQRKAAAVPAGTEMFIRFRGRFTQKARSITLTSTVTPSLRVDTIRAHGPFPLSLKWSFNGQVQELFHKGGGPTELQYQPAVLIPDGSTVTLEAQLSADVQLGRNRVELDVDLFGKA